MAFLLRHFGQRPSKYKFDVVVHSATDLPVKEGTHLVCRLRKSNSPGTGVTTSPQASEANREVCWSQHLSFQSTIFTNPATNEIYKKMFTIEVREKTPEAKRETGKETAWTAQVNIAQFASTRDTIEISLTEVPKNSVFSSCSRSSQAPSIKITFESSWISDMRDSEVSETSVMSRSPKGNKHAPPSEFVQKEGYSSAKKKLSMEEVLPKVEEREELVDDLEGGKEEQLSEEQNEEVIVQGEFQQYQLLSTHLTNLGIYISSSDDWFCRISRKLMDLRPKDLTSTMTSLIDDETASSSRHESDVAEQECEGEKKDFYSYEEYCPASNAAALLLPAVVPPSELPVPNYGSTTTVEPDVCTRAIPSDANNGKKSFASCFFCCAP